MIFRVDYVDFVTKTLHNIPVEAEDEEEARQIFEQEHSLDTFVSAKAVDETQRRKETQARR